MQEFFQTESGSLISAAALSKDKTFAGRLESVYNNLPEALKQGKEGALIGAILGGGSRGVLQIPNALANRRTESPESPQLTVDSSQPTVQSPQSEPVFTGTKGDFTVSDAAAALARQRETVPQAGVRFLQNEFGLTSAAAKDVLYRIETEMPKARYFTPEETAPPLSARFGNRAGNGSFTRRYKRPRFAFADRHEFAPRRTRFIISDSFAKRQRKHSFSGFGGSRTRFCIFRR